MTLIPENFMKLSFLRPTLLLALAVGLTACGGKATFDVQGTITDLKYAGMVLSNTNNGDTLTVPAGATTFKMPSSIEYGSEYTVTVKTQPAHQSCAPINGSDTAGRMAAINIVISCSVNKNNVGGVVSGLTADGLVLINGSGDQVTLAKDAVVYAFPGAVAYGSTYSVNVLTQPAGLTCTVANAVGEMGDAAVTNANVTCVAKVGA